jgi:hypothetical protein
VVWATGSSPNPLALTAGAPVTLGTYSSPTFGSTAHFTVSVLIPSNGFVYMNVHLDYGLKGMGGYTKSAISSDAIAGTCTTPATIVPIVDHAAYTFSQTAPADIDDSVYNCNVFKRNPGVGGMAQSVTTTNPTPGCVVKLKKNSNGAIVGTCPTDEDGVYMIGYKHTGAAAPYTVMLFLPGNNTNTPNFQQGITMQANKFYEAMFPNCP